MIGFKTLLIALIAMFFIFSYQLESVSAKKCSAKTTSSSAASVPKTSSTPSSTIKSTTTSATPKTTESDSAQVSGDMKINASGAILASAILGLASSGAFIIMG